MRKLLLLFSFAASVLVGSDVVQYLPDLTPGNATGTGVVGGIPTTRTQHLPTILTASQGDDTAAINNAIQAASSGEYVLLGGTSGSPQTFTISSRIVHKNGVTLRGGGPAGTIIQVSGSFNHAMFVGIDGDWPYSYTGTNFASDASVGGSTVTLTSAASFSIGDMLVLTQDNATYAAGGRFQFKYSTGNTANLRRQQVTVTGKSGNTLTVSPALYTNYTTARHAVAHIVAGGYQSGVGIEDLTVDCNNTVANGINAWQTLNCWAKNVKVINATAYSIYLLECVHFELRHSDALGKTGGGSNGAGILGERSSACLIVDCRVTGFPTGEFNFGWTGNGIFATLFKDSTTGGTVGAAIDTNHGPDNGWNLYEYSIAPNIQCDGNFGTTSDDVFAHCWLTSVSPGASSPRSPVLLNRGTSYYTGVGNVLGTPGQSVATYLLGKPHMGDDVTESGTSQVSLGIFPASYPTTKDPNSDPSGYDASYLERDLDVAATCTFKDNYTTQSGGIPTGEVLTGGQTVKDCYLNAAWTSTSAPDFFGTLPLKGINSHAGVPANIAVIPAGWRELYGNEDYLSGGGDTTAPTPNPSTIAIAAATGTTTATVVATTATDSGTPPVQYAVSTDNGSTWSAWQSSATFNISGLTPSTTYQCKVKARDSASTPNETTPSSASSITTSSNTTSAGARKNPAGKLIEALN